MFNFGGGMLTGSEIKKQIKKGNIRISPYDESCINPNSYNLKLHPQLLIYSRNSYRSILMPENTNNIDPPIPSTYFTCNNYNPNYDNYNPNYDNYNPNYDNYNPCIKEYNYVSNITNTNIANSYLDKISEYDKFLSNPLDMKIKNETIELTIPEEGYILYPGTLYIGRTVEQTWSDKFIPMINGRSSGGRLGLSIHICAGFGDIGFDGTWTLELSVVEPLRIYPFTEIAQVCYFKPFGKIDNLYNGRYFGQIDATASRFYKPKE